MTNYKLKIDAVKPVEQSVNHIFAVDVSGSMYDVLPKMRNHIKSKLALLVKPKDTVSIIYFSSKSQYGVVFEGQVINGLQDLSKLHQAVDKFLQTLGLTGFVEPIQESMDIASRLKGNGNINSFIFMTDGYDNQWSKAEILKKSKLLPDFFDSISFIEYGWYCNRPLIAEMAQVSGGSHIFSEDYVQYEPTVERLFQNKTVKRKPVNISGDFAFYLDNGEVILVDANDGVVNIPEDVSTLYLMAEDNDYKNQISSMDDQAKYVALYVAVHKMKTDLTWALLKSLGDVKLIKLFSNCFSKQEYSKFKDAVKLCIFDEKERFVDGVDYNLVPKEDAYTLLAALDDLMKGENFLLTNHESFNYNKIGASAVQKNLHDDKINELKEQLTNAVDAGATHCNITIDNNGYKVSDDGRGFQSRQEVDEFFETFGTPHKEGDAVYGRFRMGRGQLFAFSSTIWKTTNFTMTVDIKKNGLDYVLEENRDFAPGCTIVGQWYEYMADQSVYLMIKELEKLIKYMQIPVLVNGKDMTVKVDDQKWDYKEDDYYVKVNRGGTTLSVYNMGALVSHYPASRFGVAGVIVTKSALKVNFARNDVLISECSLWKKISKKMFEIMGIETSKKNILTDSERDAIINSLLTRSIYASSVLNKGLILDVSGKKINLKNLLKISKLCFSSGEKRHKKIEERINDSKMSIVLSDSNFSKFGVTEGNAFIEKIKELVKENNEHYNNLIKNNKDNYHLYQNLIYETFNPQIEDVFKLGQNISDKSTLIDNKKLIKKESIFLKVVESINLDIARITYNTIDGEGYKEYWNNVKKFQRRIYLGNSDIADAWTDGSSFIAINKGLVNADPMRIVHLLVHEYCHNESTLESHDHGMDFYEAYHNVMKVYASDISNSIYKIQKSYNKLMLKEGLAPKKSFDINIKNTEDYYSLVEQEQVDKIVVNLD